MPDLVPEMPEERAIGLIHGGAAAFALGVVGLGESEGDDAAFVAGQHRSGGGRFGEELEAEAMHRIFAARRERQMQVKQ